MPHYRNDPAGRNMVDFIERTKALAAIASEEGEHELAAAYLRSIVDTEEHLRSTRTLRERLERLQDS